MTRPMTPAQAQVAAVMKEQVLQTHVGRLARAFGWLSYHTRYSVGSTPGFPDLVLVHPVQRRTLWRELKTMKGKVSPAQEKWLADLTAAGQDAAVWRPEDLVTERIREQLDLQAGDR